MYVVFLYGRPATGKYTIGKLVAEELGIPLFHNHLTVDLVGSLFEFGTPEFVQMRERIWVDAFTAASDDEKSFVFTFNPENTVEQSTIDKMRTAIEGSGGEIIFIELVCSDEEIEGRIANKSREKFGKLTDVELFQELNEEGVFDAPVIPEPFLRIDTTRKSPEESAKKIVGEITNELG